MSITEPPAQKPEKKKRTAQEIGQAYTWRLSACILWVWFFDAVFLKFVGRPLFCLPNLALLFLFVPVALAIYQGRALKTFQFMLYLICFPLVAFWILIGPVLHIMAIVERAIGQATSGWGLLFSFIAFLALQIFSLSVESRQFQLPLAWSIVALTWVLLLCVLKWAYDPLLPLRAVRKGLTACLNGLANLYQKHVISGAASSKNYDKITEQIGHLPWFERISDAMGKWGQLPSHSAKRLSIPMFVFMVVLLLSIIALGYAGSYFCLNRLFIPHQNADVFSWPATSAHPMLFDALPPTASYWDCLFESFTIMTFAHGVNLQNTAPLARLFVALEMLSSICVITLIITIFNATIGLVEDFHVFDMVAFRDGVHSRVAQWRIALQLALTSCKATPESQGSSGKKLEGKGQ